MFSELFMGGGYVLNIIVVGIGKVGYTVAEQLSQEMHDVTIIDTDEDVINDTLQDIDVIGVIGDGATSKTLIDAGIDECDLLIALTGSDELNLLSCLLAKQLGAGSTIARVRNPEYNNDLRLIKDSLGLTMAVNPEREAAAEIQRILKFPTARNVDIFGHGKVDLLSFVANKNCNLCDKASKDSFAKFNLESNISKNLSVIVFCGCSSLHFCTMSICSCVISLTIPQTPTTDSGHPLHSLVTYLSHILFLSIT